MFFVMAMAGMALITAHVPSARAATNDSSVFVMASAGRGSTWDDEGNIGAGVSAGGSVEWRFRPQWSAAFRVERLGHERHTSQDLLVFSGRTVFATGEIKYRFGSGRVVPYAVGGFGAALYSGTLTDRFGPTVTRHRTSRSTVVLGGGGVEVPLGRAFVVMPELRLYFCQPQQDFAPWSAIRGGVNAGWRF